MNKIIYVPILKDYRIGVNFDPKSNHRLLTMNDLKRWDKLFSIFDYSSGTPCSNFRESKTVEN